MTFLCVQPPTVLAVDIRQAADNLGVDGTESDGQIAKWVRGIVSSLEKHIQQCLMRQTWVGTLRAFPDAIELPHPVLRVVEIEYLDVDGLPQTLPVNSVRLLPRQYTTLLKPARGQSWPATFCDEEAVTVTVECGYGNDPDDIPHDISLYILAKLVEQYDPAAGGERVTVQTSYLESMLNPYVRYA